MPYFVFVSKITPYTLNLTAILKGKVILTGGF